LAKNKGLYIVKQSKAMTTAVIDKFGVVATSGGGAELLDGTASIYVKSVRVSDLSPSRPVITDATATLASGNILISQVDGLAAALAGTISNPLISDLAGNGFALTNFKYLGLANNPGPGDVLVNNSLFIAANIPRFRSSTGQAYDVITSAGGDAQFYKGATVGIGPVGAPSFFNFPRFLPGDFGTANNYLRLNAGTGDMVWVNSPNQALSTTDSPSFVNTTLTGALLSPDTLTTLTITDTGVRAFADSQVLASFRRDGSELVSYDQENTITAFSTSSGNSEIVLSHDTGTLAERSILTLDSAGLVAEFAGTVRLLINDEIAIQDAAGVERLFTSGNYTSLRAGTGAADRFDQDGTGAYIAVQGNPVFWAFATGNSTRIWCPDDSSALHIDGSGVGVNGAYYFPPADGTAATVLTTNGAGAVSWQPIPSPGLFSQVNPATVSNTTAKTSLINLAAAAGSTTLPANYFTGNNGAAIIFRMTGNALRTNGAGRTLRLRFEIAGGATLCDTGVRTLPNTAAPVAWSLTVQAMWNGAQLVSNLTFNFGIAGACYVAAGNTAINTLISNQFTISATWGNASALNVITSNGCVMSRLF
jgi:hypothetical protein